MTNEEKHCDFCKHYKEYFGFPYCMINTLKPSILSTYPHNPECFEERDLKHNYTTRPTSAQKEQIKLIGNSLFEPGNCEKCIYRISQLNYCSAFGEKCGTFECYYKNTK